MLSVEERFDKVSRCAQLMSPEQLRESVARLAPIVDGYEYIGRVTRPDGTVADESTRPHSKPRFWFVLAAAMWHRRHPDYRAELLRRSVGSEEAWEVYETRPGPVATSVVA